MSEYTGIYEAVVQDLDDPDKQGRARLLVPAALGMAMSGWARPVLGPNSPEDASVGDRVWVIFEQGAVGKPTWIPPKRSNTDELSGVVPVGTVLEYGGDAVPNVNYVFANGQMLPKADYPVLAARYGTKYNTGGEPSTHFRVVKRDGRVGVGLDSTQTEFNTLGKTGGAKTHTLTIAEMPSHTHVQNAHTHVQNAHTHVQNAHSHSGTTGNDSPDHAHSIGFSVTNAEYSWTLTGAGGAGYVVPGTVTTSGASARHQHSIPSDTATNQNATATNQNATATNQNTGGDGAHNNLQPYVTMNYIIRAR